MNKAKIQLELQESSKQFTNYIQSLSEADFLYSWNSKWTAGQQLDHIIKSTSPVKTALSLPPFVLKLLFGRANRPSKSYDALVEKYQAKLDSGGKATSRFIPPDIKFSEREKLISKQREVIKLLTGLINRFSETQLDMLLLPHPLLGKLTLREMLYFTIHHIGHHENHTMENLQKRSS